MTVLTGTQIDMAQLLTLRAMRAAYGASHAARHLSGFTLARRRWSSLVG